MGKRQEVQTDKPSLIWILNLEKKTFFFFQKKAVRDSDKSKRGKDKKSKRERNN